MREPPKRVLDLFCGAGGAAMGLHQAWPDAEITGVDNRPQPHYPFRFIQADVIQWMINQDDFNFIWASPVCKKYTVASRRWDRNHPDQIPTVRSRLIYSRTAYCIENVPGAPLIANLELCGQMFGLRLTRHRIFECSFICPEPKHPDCRGMAMNGKVVAVHGHGCAGNKYKKGIRHTTADWKDAMRIDWMTRDEMAQAVPPAYSRYIAEQYLLT